MTLFRHPQVGNLADSKLDGILNRWLKEDQRVLQPAQRQVKASTLHHV
jgi:hypothetical protein